MYRQYTYDSKYLVQDEHFGDHGIFKSKERTFNFPKVGNTRFAYRNREFWRDGYYIDAADENEKAIKEYISNRLKLDQESDKLSMCV